MPSCIVISVVVLMLLSDAFSALVKALQPLECGTGAQCTQNLYWKNLHASDVSKVKVAVYPLGSIENHGPHLPIGTDLLLAEAIATSAVSGIHNIAVLPPSAFGASFEHENKRGTIAVQDSHLNGLWDDVFSGLVQSAVRKVLLVNAHGGQTPNAEIAIRRFRFQHKALAVNFNVQAALAHAWKTVETRSNKLKTESVYGIHGGLIETAIMLHLFPQLVNTAHLKHFKPRRIGTGNILEPHGTFVSFGWRSEDLCDSGALGDATSGSSEIGAAIFAETVRALRQVILELLKADAKEVLHLPDDTDISR